MAISQFYRQPNAQAYRYADTQQPILGLGQLSPSTVRLGSPNGPAYNPSAGLTNPLSRPLTPAAGADPSDRYSLLRKVVNPDLQASFEGRLGGLNTNAAANESSLKDFTANLLAQKPGNQANLGQEQQSIDRIFDGTISRELGDLRNRYAQAARGSTEQAIAGADAIRKAASIGSGFGGSSYFNRQAMGQRNQAYTGLAKDIADRERADFGAIESLKNSMLGQRRRLGLDVANDELLGIQARNAVMQGDMSNLGALSQLYRGNQITGVTDNENDVPYFPAFAPQPGYTPSNFNFGNPPLNAPPRFQGGNPLQGGGSGGYGPSGGNVGANSALYAAQERERNRLRSFYGANPQSSFIGPVIPSNIPSNLYSDLTPEQQAEYMQMLEQAPQYTGAYE